MIMAAGKGTRMMPLTADRPKPLVEVGGVALLDHVLSHLRGAGISRIVINTHYRAEQIEQHMAQHATDLCVTISDERVLLRDTGGGLVQALPLIQSDPFLCVNADNWWADIGENAFKRLIAAWDDSAMDVLMLVIPFDQANNTQGEGDFDLNSEGRLSRRKAGQRGAYVWTGIQMMSKRLIIDPPSDVFSTNIFWDRAIAKYRCFDVGYPQAIEMTQAKLLEHG
jgi:N-acetyl-alpha-D-muramate 1-phosphate uridylyltransferase